MQFLSKLNTLFEELNLSKEKIEIKNTILLSLFNKEFLENSFEEIMEQKNIFFFVLGIIKYDKETNFNLCIGFQKIGTFYSQEVLVIGDLHFVIVKGFLFRIETPITTNEKKLYYYNCIDKKNRILIHNIDDNIQILVKNIILFNKNEFCLSLNDIVCNVFNEIEPTLNTSIILGISNDDNNAIYLMKNFVGLQNNLKKSLSSEDF